MYVSHNEERVKEKNPHSRMKRKKKSILVLRYEAISLQVLILKEFIFSPLTINHPSPSYVKTVFILAQTATDVT